MFLSQHPHPVHQQLKKQETFDGVDSDDDRPFSDVPDLSRDLPQASDKTTEILDSALSGLDSRLDINS